MFFIFTLFFSLSDKFYRLIIFVTLESPGNLWDKDRADGVGSLTLLSFFSFPDKANVAVRREKTAGPDWALAAAPRRWNVKILSFLSLTIRVTHARTTFIACGALSGLLFFPLRFLLPSYGE